MTTISIIVPVLGRPERAGPLVASIEATTPEPHEIVFVASPNDKRQIVAAVMTGHRVLVMAEPPEPGDYARKINHGIAETRSPWIFQAADDLRFHEGWLEQALDVGAPVTGTNDMGNPLVVRGGHATHSVVSRHYVETYGTIDEPGKLLHEGYTHCWVDNELVETARSRGAFRSARRSRVEHLHHIWRKGKDDATYRRGQERYHEDHLLFLERRPLWRSVRPKR